MILNETPLSLEKKVAFISPSHVPSSNNWQSSKHYLEMATRQNSHKEGLSMAFFKAGKLARNYPPDPDPAAPVASAMTKPRNWLLSRKSSSGPEIKRVNSERRVSIVEEGRGRGGAVVEGRRSVSQVETNLESVVAFLQVKVMVSDMPGFMQVHAFRCARRTYDSLEKFSSKHLAFNMKKVRHVHEHISLSLSIISSF